MNDRKQILQLLAEGQITVEEADQLIAALEPHPPSRLPANRESGKAPKYLRVVVENTNGPSEEPGHVNVRVPFQLLRAGVQLTTLIPKPAVGQVNEELRKSGVPIDISQLKPEHLDDLIAALDELTLDVDQPDAKVRVFCE
jgi:hypothetical protein